MKQETKDAIKSKALDAVAWIVEHPGLVLGFIAGFVVGKVL